MRKSLIFALLVACCVPIFARAAFDDVTLTTDTVISVGGYTLNISGSSATIESIVVRDTSFSVTLASGSSFTVSSPTLNQLSLDAPSNVTENICTSSASSVTLEYSGGGTTTNIITPSATVCGSTSGSGGNGPPLSGPMSVGYKESGTETVASTSATLLTPSSIKTNKAVSPPFVFTKNLRLRMTHADVRELQKYLNAQGFIIAKTGVGSLGKETTYFGALTYKALIAFQEAHAEGILAPAGLSRGTGYFGPGTRVFINRQN